MQTHGCENLSGPQCQRIPGRIRGRRFVKTVKARNRMSRPFPGWGLSVEQLCRVQVDGVQTVELRVDSGEVLIASIERILADGKPIHYIGFEPQLLVPLTTWTVRATTQPDLFLGGIL